MEVWRLGISLLLSSTRSPTLGVVSSQCQRVSCWCMGESLLWCWLLIITWHFVRSVDAAWRGFANALSGLLCASLNFIGKTETVSPHLSFKPEGYLSGKYWLIFYLSTTLIYCTDFWLGDDERFIRYAVLPRENLCTENLTPWLKLLPCGSSVSEIYLNCHFMWLVVGL